MSQSVVTIRLNGTPYQIGCGPGEEAHITALGVEVEEILQSLVGSVGQIGETRLLAMVTLILADKLADAKAANMTGGTAGDAATGNGAETSADSEAQAAVALEAAADRIASMAAALATRLASD